MAAKKTKAIPERTRLSREAIIQEAVRLTGEIGIATLSMRKLAEALKVEAMSLYNHVKNKEDLLDAMVDSIVAEMALPDMHQNWRAEIYQATISSHEVLLKHPWAGMLIVSRVTNGPAKLAHFNAIQGCLSNAGFSPQMADQIRNVIDSHLYGFTLQKLLYPTLESDYAKTAEQFLPSLPQASYPHAYALVQAFAKGEYDGKHALEFGLNMLLDGFESILNSGSTTLSKPHKSKRNQ